MVGSKIICKDVEINSKCGFHQWKVFMLFTKGVYVTISVNNFLNIVTEIPAVNTLKNKMARSDAFRETVIEISRRIILATQEIFDFPPKLLKWNLKIAKEGGVELVCRIWLPCLLSRRQCHELQRDQRMQQAFPFHGQSHSQWSKGEHKKLVAAILTRSKTSLLNNKMPYKIYFL